MNKLDWIERERTITERGIVLPFTLPAIAPAYPGGFSRQERSGEAFVTDELLYELLETDSIMRRLVISDREVEQALEDAGLITVSARGSVAASQKLRDLMKGIE